VLRSKEAAARFEAAIAIVDDYDRAIVAAWRDGSIAAVERHIFELLAANGLKSIPDRDWGGFKVVPDDEPYEPEFPTWIMNEEVKQRLSFLSHKLGRTVTSEEDLKVVREWALAQLRWKQELALKYFGMTLAQQESARRADRRRRSDAKKLRAELARRAQIKVVWTRADHVLRIVGENHGIGINMLIEALKSVGHGGRRADVMKELRALELSGRLQITKAKVGQKQSLALVPGVVPPVGL
jgi:hypothetical protein